MIRVFRAVAVREIATCQHYDSSSSLQLLLSRARSALRLADRLQVDSRDQATVCDHNVAVTCKPPAKEGISIYRPLSIRISIIGALIAFEDGSKPKAFD